jgi:hypothetical protein
MGIRSTSTDIGEVSTTADYTDIFCLVNPYRTQNRNFLYIHPVEKDIQKYSVYSLMIARNFLDSTPHSHTIKKYSG